MSVSGFHHPFKAVTAMSPLQFQKQLRLQEARRLMLGEHLDAASAGLRVGYDDASQFSREYKRRFGQPPGTREAGGRDVERLREAARSEAPLSEPNPVNFCPIWRISSAVSGVFSRPVLHRQR
jgi:AraC-like DNA-binding protein